MSIFDSADPEKLAEEIINPIRSELHQLYGGLMGPIQEIGGAVQSFEQRISDLEGKIKTLADGAENAGQGLEDDISSAAGFIKKEVKYAVGAFQKLPSLSTVGADIEAAILHVLEFESARPSPREKLNRLLVALEKSVGPLVKEFGMNFVISMIEEVRTVLAKVGDGALALLAYPLHGFDIDHFENVAQAYSDHRASQQARPAGAAATPASIRGGSYKSMILKASLDEKEGAASTSADKDKKDGGSYIKEDIGVPEIFIILLNFVADTCTAIAAIVPLQVQLDGKASLGFVFSGGVGVGLTFVQITAMVCQPIVIICKVIVNLLQATVDKDIVLGENRIIQNQKIMDKSVAT